jgi:DNA-binding response OmpR family regulator
MSRDTTGQRPGIVFCVGVAPDEVAELAKAVSNRTMLMTAPDSVHGRAVLYAAAGLSPPQQVVGSVVGPAVDAAGTPDTGQEIRVGALALDVERRVATWGEHVLDLPARAFDLLVVLSTDPGRTWTFADLTRRVWDRTYLGDADAVISAVKRLRRRLAAVAPQVHVESVRGVGFRLRVADALEPVSIAPIPRPRFG